MRRERFGRINKNGGFRFKNYWIIEYLYQAMLRIYIFDNVDEYEDKILIAANFEKKIIIKEIE